MSSPHPLASFSSTIRDAHDRWLADRTDLAALDAVVLAIVAYHRPNRSLVPDPDNLPDTANLMTDVGYDSLALAEIVFFVEDLYQVSISNEDLKTILTVSDLRAYVRTKVSAPATPAA
jgi:acyl carrier protein